MCTFVCMCIVFFILGGTLNQHLCSFSFRGRISSSGQVKLGVFVTLYSIAYIALYIYESEVSRFRHYLCSLIFDSLFLFDRIERIYLLLKNCKTR